jgi:hypothetical protein
MCSMYGSFLRIPWTYALPRDCTKGSLFNGGNSLVGLRVLRLECLDITLLRRDLEVFGLELSSVSRSSDE